MHKDWIGIPLNVWIHSKFYVYVDLQYTITEEKPG